MNLKNLSSSWRLGDWSRISSSSFSPLGALASWRLVFLLDKDTRNTTQRARKLLGEDYAAQLEGDFDVRRDGALTISSPGGFPTGISAENILERQAPRNRRLADALARCGLVERSGQGADRMFSAAVSEGKLPPDFSGGDEYLVSVVLHGQVQDEAFLRFLERLAEGTKQQPNLDDLIVLDAVHRGSRIPPRVQVRVSELVALGAIERLGPKKLTLSRRFYAMVGKRGEYTRRRGLDREACKALLLQHIEQNAQDGSPLSELNQILPHMTSTQVQNLVRELKIEGRVHPEGRTKAARWFPGTPDPTKTDAG